MEAYYKQLQIWTGNLEEAWAQINKDIIKSLDDNEVRGFEEKLIRVKELLEQRTNSDELESVAQGLYASWERVTQNLNRAEHGQKSVPLQPIPIGEHQLPPLPYSYEALEPYIAAEIMRLHHQEHHQSYVDGLNKAEKKMEEARKTGDFDLIKHWEREAAFNGAGHYLHTIFWNVMSPKGGGEPRGEFANQLRKDFSSFQQFKKHFSEAAKKVEAVGWAILVWAPRAHRLEILQAEKHQNLSQWDVVPLLPLDVWEHAYYLQYKNEREQYINNWWNVVNWPHVDERYKKARELRWQPF
ncbi:superoxide dismutase [Alkalihalobacterium elongatum]|uniref:superoxide dismutase n=1 Tax=Alkalihalobacterium elongatum TaxID=2675466 RepID=UPI001C1FFF18|nr:superoxide dismutase [Alkalihalobacterium elongatum]